MFSAFNSFFTAPPVVAGSYDPDAVILFAAMSVQPDATRKGLISNFFAGLKADGIFTKLDELWLLAGHTSQASLLGIKRLSDATAVSSPTFTTDRGFAGNGTSSYINSNLNASTAANYTTNSCSFGIYARTNVLETSADMGSRVSSSLNQAALFSRLSVTGTDSMSFRPNVDSPVNADTSVANSDSRGFFAANRSGSSATQGYKNGSQVLTKTSGVPAAAPYNGAFFIGALNNNGAPGLFSTRQIACAFMGANLNSTEHANLYSRIQTYMTAIGANV